MQRGFSHNTGLRYVNLAGPDGSWINGQVLRTNGGII